MTSVKKIAWLFIGIATLCLALGFCFVIWPGVSAEMICYVAGAVFFLLGILRVIMYFRKNAEREMFSFDISIGLIFFTAAIILVLHPFEIIEILPVIAGIGIVFDGIIKVQTSLDACRLHIANWWVILITALISVALGFLLIFNPFKGAIMTVMGIFLIANGIENIYAAIFINKFEKQRKELQTYNFEEDGER